MRQRSRAAPPSLMEALERLGRACLPTLGVYGSQRMWPRLRESPEARRPLEGCVLGGAGVGGGVVGWRGRAGQTLSLTWAHAWVPEQHFTGSIPGSWGN